MKKPLPQSVNGNVILAMALLVVTFWLVVSWICAGLPSVVPKATCKRASNACGKSA